MGPGLRSRTESWLGVIGFAAVLIAGALLRFASLGRPSFWLDESLGYQLTDASVARPWWAWLTGLEHEHGPLYYATEMLGRLVTTSPEASARLLPAFLGLITIALIWFAARTLDDDDPLLPFVAATIVATNAMHVYYSREARPYALSMTLAAALTLALLRRAHPGWIAMLTIAAMYTSATDVPLVGAFAIVAFAATWLKHGRQERRRGWINAAIAIAALLLTPMLYRGGGATGPAPDFPTIDCRFLLQLARAFSASTIDAASPSLSRLTIASILLALLGAVAITRRDRRAGIVVIGMAVAPIVCALLSLRALGHWYAVRYVSAGLPAYLLLVGAGVLFLATICGRRACPVVALLLVGAIVTCTLPSALRDPYQKLDWRAIASTLWSHAQVGDRVIAAEPWSYASLGFYLRRLPPRVHLYLPATPAAIGDPLGERDPAWLVSAGYTPDSRLKEWMCNEPIVLASSLESFRLHYAPSLRHFLQTRATPAEARAQWAAAANGGRVFAVSVDDPFFLGDGRADIEGSGAEAMRWVIGQRASFVVPGDRLHDRTLVLAVNPMSHETLPPQTMEVILNGHSLGTTTLVDGWHDVVVDTPAGVWVDGMNRIELALGRANAPADLEPSLHDRRLLSVAFRRLTIGDRGTTPLNAPAIQTRTVRLAEAGPYVDEASAWRGTPPTKFPPSAWKHDATWALLGRLGFDPEPAWNALQRGSLRIEDFVQTIASSSACEDDGAFTRRAFAVILQRAPDRNEETSVLRMLRGGRSREEVLRKILKIVP